MSDSEAIARSHAHADQSKYSNSTALLSFVGMCIFIISEKTPLPDGLLYFFVNRV